MTIHSFTIDRYAEVLTLWRQTPGVCIRDADSLESTQRYLQRNPGLSFVAEVDDRIVGSAMCGHDGRRGYLQHVAVDSAYRNRGIAQALISRCLAGLEREGIMKVHLDVLVTNVDAQEFWQRRGWKRRHDILRYSLIPSRDENA